MRTNLTKLFFTTSSLLLLAAGGLADAASDPVEDLKKCARMTDKTARVACYEALGKRVLGEEAIVSTSEGQNPAAPDLAMAASPEIESAGNRRAAIENPTSNAVSVEPRVDEVAAVTAASVPPESDRMPDYLGRSDKKERKEKKSEEKKTYRGHVKSCGQMSDDRWYFVFDNGQVWKQSSDGSYRFGKCDFDVTITKDFFSYKMKIDGGKSLRVRRER